MTSSPRPPVSGSRAGELVAGFIVERNGGYDQADLRRVKLPSAKFDMALSYVETRLHTGQFTLSYVVGSRTRDIAGEDDWERCTAALRGSTAAHLRVKPFHGEHKPMGTHVYGKPHAKSTRSPSQPASPTGPRRTDSMRRQDSMRRAESARRLDMSKRLDSLRRAPQENGSAVTASPGGDGQQSRKHNSIPLQSSPATPSDTVRRTNSMKRTPDTHKRADVLRRSDSMRRGGGTDGTPLRGRTDSMRRATPLKRTESLRRSIDTNRSSDRSASQSASPRGRAADSGMRSPSNSFHSPTSSSGVRSPSVKSRPPLHMRSPSAGAVRSPSLGASSNPTNGRASNDAAGTTATRQRSNSSTYSASGRSRADSTATSALGSTLRREPSFLRSPTSANDSFSPTAAMLAAAAGAAPAIASPKVKSPTSVPSLDLPRCKSKGDMYSGSILRSHNLSSRSQTSANLSQLRNKRAEMPACPKMSTTREPTRAWGRDRSTTTTSSSSATPVLAPAKPTTQVQTPRALADGDGEGSNQSMKTAPASPPLTPSAASLFSAISETGSPPAKFVAAGGGAKKEAAIWDLLDAFKFGEAPSEEDSVCISRAPQLGTSNSAPKTPPEPLDSMRMFAALCASIAVNAVNPYIREEALLPDRTPSWVIKQATCRIKTFSDDDTVKEYPRVWTEFVTMVEAIFSRHGAQIEVESLLELLWYLSLHSQDEVLGKVLQQADPAKATAAMLLVIAREAEYNDPDTEFIDGCKKRLITDGLARTAAECYGEELEELFEHLNAAIDAEDSPFRKGFSKPGAKPLGVRCPIKILRETVTIAAEAAGIPAVHRGAAALAETAGEHFRLREIINSICRQMTA